MMEKSLYICEIEVQEYTIYTRTYAVIATDVRDAEYKAVNRYKKYNNGEDILSIMAWPAGSDVILMFRQKDGETF